MEELLNIYMSGGAYYYGEISGIASTTFCMYNNLDWLECVTGAMGGCWDEAGYY